MTSTRRRSSGRALLTLVAATLVLTTGATGAGQQPPTTAVPPPQNQPPRPTFRTDVNAVLVDVRVVDSNGEIVRGLAKDEFRVFEEGKEQSIATFDFIDIPIASSDPLTDKPRLEPDVVTNDLPDGRLYAIVLDDAAGHPLRSSSVRAIAREFVEHYMTDADRAIVLPTSGRRDMAQEFTNNRQRLIEAINKYEGGFGAPLGNRRNSAVVSLEALSDWLGAMSARRKALVLISENMIDLSAIGDLNKMSDEAGDIRDLIAAAARGNAVIYAIDPEGNPNAPTPGIKPVFVDDELSLADQSSRRQGLTSLAEATGGFAFVGSNDYAAAFNRVVSDNSSYYLLGYNSTDPRRDGKFREIEVRTTRPNVKVLARSGYVAKDPSLPKNVKSPKDMPPALVDVLQSPLPIPGLTLNVAALPLRGAKDIPSTAIIVEARGRDLEFTESNGRLNGSVAIILAAADKDGRVKGGERGSLSLRLSPGTHEAITQYGVRLLSKINIKPGRYQLRVGAVDVGAGSMRGSVQYDLVIPDFSKERLMMSGIALASSEGSRAPTTGPDDRWRQLLAAPPTAKRSFSADDELREFVEVYDNDKGAGHRIDVTTTVRTESGDEVFTKQQTPVTESPKGKTATTYRVVTPIPLKGMKPGPYSMSVEARSTAKGTRPVMQQIPFTIR